MRISERDFQDQVIQLAGILGWRVAHFRPAQTSRGWRTPMQGDPGFPDLVMARDGRVVFAELKSAHGRVTKEQEEWLDDLSGTDGVVVAVWRPGDLEEIKRVLGPRAR